MNIGRPVKNKFKRRKITTFLNEYVIEKIDDFVAAMKKTNSGYTRADFLNDAAQEYLEKRQAGRSIHDK